MLKVTWRNLAARKVRLLLSAMAIVLGVAFVSGSLVFTDTIGKSFDQIVYGTVPDVTVRPTSSNQSGIEQSINVDDRSIPASEVERVASLPGVSRADGQIQAVGLFVIKRNGTLLGGTGAPTLAFNDSAAPNAAGEVTTRFVQGRGPTTEGEVALDKGAAEKAGYAVGDTVKMVTANPDSPLLEAKLVGVLEFTSGGLAGATLVVFDTATAQKLFLDGKDAYTSISVAAEPGTTNAELARTIAADLPDGLEAITAAKAAAETKSLIDTVLGFLNTFLLVFAAIALVVGTFLIINTFSILVAQRSRELALLRAMGASRRQVTRSVLFEALVVGLIGSALGLLLGFGLAGLLKVLFANFGLDLSGTALVFAPRTVIVSFVVGILVTMFAAYLPARRAAKIAPVAAMRDDVALPEGAIHRRVIVGVVFAIVGAVLMGVGLFADVPQSALWVGLGIFAILMAVALTSPVLAVPVIGGFGAIYRRVFGSVGHLAAQNARRNPRRTAATASALMIGLALVTTMTVLGSSANKSIDVAVEEQFTTDFLVSNATGQGFSTGIAAQVAEVPGVAEVAPSQTLMFNVEDRSIYASAVDAEQQASIFDITYVEGWAPTADGTVAFAESVAESLDMSIGDTVTLAFNTGNLTAKVTGVYADTYVVGGAMVPFSTVSEAGIKRTDSMLAVNAEPGAGLKTVGRNLESALKQFPTITVQNQADFAESQRAQVNLLLNLIYALLGLAIVIAVLGIVNTLALSVIERTREVGLLRAVGLTRAQLGTMVLLESVAIAVLGALLGIAAGLLFGVALQQAFADDGITDLAIPLVRLVVFVLLAMVVGVLAAVIPARRAAKLDVLKAIGSE